MLSVIARFAIRFRWLALVVWFVGAIGATRVLPSLARTADRACRRLCKPVGVTGSAAPC
jgi:uncharacterized membrane protein YdfJ with MMPL/SSD domain